MHTWFRSRYGWSQVGQASSVSSRGGTCLLPSPPRLCRRPGGTVCSATVTFVPPRPTGTSTDPQRYRLGVTPASVTSDESANTFTAGRRAPTPTWLARSPATSRRRSDADSGARPERPDHRLDDRISLVVDADPRLIRWHPSAWQMRFWVLPWRASEPLAMLYVEVSPIHALRNRDHRNSAPSRNSVVPFLRIEPWG
jgi:hypothetical protein